MAANPDDPRMEKPREAALKKVHYQHASKRYKLWDVIDAVVNNDLPVMIDAARLYPALVISLMTNPLLTLRSLFGHRKARRSELKLKNLYYLERQTWAEEALSPEGDEPEDPDDDEPESEDEARSLLERLKVEAGDNS